MKIDFTGITKEEAIIRLEKAANEKRLFAARIGSLDAAQADKAAARAQRYDVIAAMLHNSDGDIHMSSDDESLLYFALAQCEYTFWAANSLYTITPESVNEIPFEVALAEGAANAEKTNF